MALSDWEPRPADADYYASRTTYVRQGDIFRDVPLGYPWPPDAIDHSEGRRKFLSGPFEPGFGMLITPTCSYVAQGPESSGYAHPARSLAPVLPLERLVDEGAVKARSVDDLRSHDHLVNYFYVPPIEEQGLPESLALLYTTTTIHHDYLEGHRITQLSEVGEIHLKYKLGAMFTGSLFSHDDFAAG